MYYATTHPSPVGRLTLAIIIPCHRVVGARGNLTGYAGGIDVKIRLLEMEGMKIDKSKGVAP